MSRSTTAPLVSVRRRRRPSSGSASVILSILAMLSERWNPRQRLTGRGGVPVGGQLFDMERRPLEHERESARWESADEDAERRDRDLDLIVPVVRMEVRRLVIAPVHPDCDTEEP